MQMGKVNEKDANTFRAMQEPHASGDAINAAVDAFLADVGAAREKHRIAEVLTVCSVKYLGADGEEIDAMVNQFYGDQTHAEAVSAYALGRYGQARQQLISDILRQGVKSPKAEK